ncbi:hypothetical protein L596_013306 [Steinernema carpocapsae]|uniref:Uncharacterized protein n=1 Tax=Steinernema carpocapsae TaxID=34508 RepID=A0A4U5P0L6_STECR|nr:hypothetical protein L596_013306 [Steinernema carpocapsae]
MRCLCPFKTDNRTIYGFQKIGVGCHFRTLRRRVPTNNFQDHATLQQYIVKAISQNSHSKRGAYHDRDQKRKSNKRMLISQKKLLTMNTLQIHEFG